MGNEKVVIQDIFGVFKKEVMDHIIRYFVGGFMAAIVIALGTIPRLMAVEAFAAGTASDVEDLVKTLDEIEIKVNKIDKSVDRLLGKAGILE